MSTRSAAGCDLFSIGHSSHKIDQFVSILHQLGIGAVADVRSTPWSRFNEQYNRRNLEGALSEAGITYVYLGNELGGRPDDPDLYDEAEHVLYGRLARTESFHTGMERLRRGAKDYTLAMMCSEENPEHCHRFLLITRVFHSAGVRVGHIRAAYESDLPTDPPSVRLEETEDIATFEDWTDTDYLEESLFGAIGTPWRSTRPVSQRNPQGSSSPN